jgi:hypothetical protein
MMRRSLLMGSQMLPVDHRVTEASREARLRSLFQGGLARRDLAISPNSCCIS